MIEELAPNIFRIVVPLPIPVISSMNAYVITDPARHLIVDPGMAHTLCFDAMQMAVRELSLDLGRTDFFMTHHHMDHFGLVSWLMAEGSVIYINGVEASSIERIASQEILEDMTFILQRIGFPEKDPMKVASELLGDEYRARSPWPFRHVFEGDLIERGGHIFTCIVTPGHTMAHTCLWEAHCKILFSGDAISPVVQFLSDRDNPLQNHLESLDRLRRMDIDVILPGHDAVFRDHRGKIDQLKALHVRKTQASLAILADGEKTAFDVASCLHQHTKGLDPWETLSPILKFISARDSLAHLRYLENIGKVRSQVNGAKIFAIAT
jgi:glyoxylase-like metal-dependent hydrolase (beta-lactamase superfamily II)